MFIWQFGDMLSWFHCYQSLHFSGCRNLHGRFSKTSRLIILFRSVVAYWRTQVMYFCLERRKQTESEASSAIFHKNGGYWDIERPWRQFNDRSMSQEHPFRKTVLLKERLAVVARNFYYIPNSFVEMSKIAPNGAINVGWERKFGIIFNACRSSILLFQSVWRSVLSRGISCCPSSTVIERDTNYFSFPRSPKRLSVSWIRELRDINYSRSVSPIPIFNTLFKSPCEVLSRHVLLVSPHQK